MMKQSKMRTATVLLLYLSSYSIIFRLPVTISATFVSLLPPSPNAFTTNSNSLFIHKNQQCYNSNKHERRCTYPLIARKARSEDTGGEDGNEKRNDSEDEDDIPTLFDVYTPLLTKRLTKLRAQLLEEQMKKPPNPNLDPVQVITFILQELNESSGSVDDNNAAGNDDNDSSSTNNNASSTSSTSFVLPDSGFRTLIRSSTNGWKTALRKSVGAPNEATEEQLVSALSSAMSRPNNQYQILVCSDNEMDNDGNKNYRLYFPGDVFEYDEGKAWVESQLRHPKTGKLLAILAWSLIQRESDGSWLIDWLDWQDFRDEFRPGIGREEWSRICG